MTPSTRSLWSAVVGVTLLAITATAQTPQFTADSVALLPNGGTLKLLAALSYTDRPSAVGWTITLPKGWTLEKVGGGNPPSVAPEAGSAGQLEFAYVSVPDYLASFELTVRYPADAGKVSIAASVIVRSRGKVDTLEPKSLQLAAP